MEPKCEFVKDQVNTNIIIMSAPHRHYLSPSSCVNTEVKTFSRRIKKLMKTFPHVTTMDIDFVRKHFTTHGLHMNFKGKYEMAQKDCYANYEGSYWEERKESNCLALEYKSRHWTAKWRHLKPGEY
jgi:hypothetical protein